jgi:hypothetical protein
MIGGVNDIKNHKFFAKINWDDLLSKKIKAPYVPVLPVISTVESDFLEKRTKLSPAIHPADDPFLNW